jgi:uncharacterized tellurite resistance protein B-like protein
MNTPLKEKLSLLSELVKLAKADQEIREEEYNFLRAIAKQLNVSDEDFQRVFEEYIEFTPPVNEFDRIVQFQRLVLMMNVDRSISKEEILYMRQIGIRMGLVPRATDEVLSEMNKHPNGLIPPEQLLSIFKTFQN